MLPLSPRLRRPLALAACTLLATCAALSQSPSASLYGGLHWRLIGPYRAGRVVAVSGVPGSDGSFFFGGVGGGVWKTTDAGTVWSPVFDQQSIASIGALAVAPSSPNILYAGTGEADIRSDLSSGNGIYRSDDSGATWRSLGLADTRQISRILVDPHDPNTVYVGALGHAYGPNAERGVYKSTDGGATWAHVLDKGPSVGIADLAMAVEKPKLLFATTWNAQRPQWSAYAPLEGPGNALYRSTDGGAHWKQLTGHGLPTGTWGRSGIAVSADGQRVYATISTSGNISGETPGVAPDKSSGLYRSDDGGESWTLINTDPRLTTRGWYFNSITVDPSDRDTLYIPNVALYCTHDGGKSISIVRGAPGGDDYHQVWVDPKKPAHLMLGVDQGASVSLDYGRTWTTWYNQPTAQLYHVTTDHKFPYTVFGAQQDSGSIAVSSRSDHGHIDTRDWYLPGGSESGYIALDPKNEDTIYLSGTYGEVVRFDKRTSFSQNVTPWPLGGFDTPINKRRYRDPWTPVLVFSPADKTSLYLGTQYVMRTTDGGLHWARISPDLTGADPHADLSATTTVANAQQQGFGVVNSVAPSPLQASLIWAGSNTGRIHITRDLGAHWADITPPQLTPWSSISLIEASHFDPATAYVAVDRRRLDDEKPYLYITHDYGKSWQPAVDGIPATHSLRAVREDPAQRGLLYAGTELGVSVSFDDGAHWQPLQLNLPTASVRDLDVHGADLVIATHGRSFWILDDVTPLRQAAALNATQAHLYAPAPVIRVDNDGFVGSPMPPEEPQADNPPSGAILDYYLPPSGAHSLRLELLDGSGHVIRHFASGEAIATRPKPRPLLPIAERWFPKPQTLETTPGMHRFVWDLAAGGAGASGLEDDEDSPGVPAGPRIPPGSYAARLVVDGATVGTQPLHVTMDPRSSATTAVLDQQYALAQSVYAAAVAGRKAMAELQGVSGELAKLSAAHPDLPASTKQALIDAQAGLAAIQSGQSGTQPAEKDNDAESASPQPGHPGLAASTAGLGTAFAVIESGNRQAPSQALVIYHQMASASQASIARWQHYKQTTLPALNQALQQASVPAIQVATIEEQVYYAMTR